MTELNNNRKIKVICAGLGRTGTLSLTEALQTLSYKPYHYIDFKHASKWTEFIEGNNCTSDDLIDVIVQDDYDAVLENPTCEIYRDLVNRFDDAKVILTVRDSPEKFEQSWKTLMDTFVVTEQTFSWRFPSFFGWIPIFQQLKKIRYFMGTTHLNLNPGELTHGWRNKPNGWLADQYTKHNEDIIKHVPKEKLLIFNVKEGWKPLCDFLDCEIPHGNISFPHSKVNDAKSLKRMKKIFVFAVYAWIPTIAVTAVSGMLFARRHVSLNNVSRSEF